MPICSARSLTLVWSLLVAWGLSRAVSAAESVGGFDFENSPAVQVYNGEKWGGSAALERAPAPRGLSAKLAWAEKHNKYLELSVAKPIPLTGFEEDPRGTFRLAVYLADPAAVRKINLRLRDAQGETFQWYKNTDSLRAGWNELTYALAPDNFTDSWGGQANKVIDPPLAFSGLAVDFTPDHGSGCLYVDDLAWSAASLTKIETKRTLYTFNDYEKWQLWGARDQAKLQPQADSVKLSIATGDATAHFELCESRRSLKPVGYPRVVTLDLEVTGGEGLRFFTQLRNQNGKQLLTKEYPCPAGAGQITVKLPDDLRPEAAALWKAGDPLFFWALHLLRPGKTPPLEVTLRRLEIEESLPRLAAIEVEVETGNPFHFLKVGEEKQLALRLHNTALSPVPFKLEAKLQDFSGETVAVERDFVIPAQGTEVWPLPVTPAKRGIWYINYRLRDPDGLGELADRRSFAYLEPAGPTPGRADGFLFSICTHTDRWGRQHYALEAEACALIGAKVARTGIGWGGIQPTADTWNWEPMDEMVAAYEKVGIELQYLCGFCPRWAAKPEHQNSKDWHDWNNRQPNLDAWRTYVTAVASRYQDKIRFYEMWNEPDIGFWKSSVEEYLDLLKVGYESVKQVNPQLLVMTGGFATLQPHPGRVNPHFQETVLEQGSKYFDIHATHEHSAFPFFQRDIDEKMLPMRQKYGITQPIYFNETAVTAMNDAQRQQAEALFKKLLFSWARGGIGYTWYDLRNDGYTPTDGEHNFGLFTLDYYPKAVCAVYNTLARNFRAAKFVAQLPLGSTQWGFVFAAPDGRQLVPLWNESASSAAEHLVLATDAERAEYLDLMDNRTELPLDNGLLVTEIGAQPGCLVLYGAKQPPEVKGALVAAAEVKAGVPGRELELTVKAWNPRAVADTLACDWLLPAGVKLVDGPREVALAAGEKRDLPLKLALDRGLKGVCTPTLLYRLTGSPWHGRMPVAVPVAHLVPAGGFERESDFVLNERSQMVCLGDNDPNSAHLLWKGPDDLSVKVWLGRENQTLKLRVAVRDDQHYQADRGSSVWRGDNIQFAFVVPGQNGSWELGLTRLGDGQDEVFAWTTPDGFSSPVAQVKLTTTPETGGLVYAAELPYAAFGLSDALLENGLRFNLIVNDNDGEARKGWAQIAPGIGDTKNPAAYPYVVFDR